MLCCRDDDDDVHGNPLVAGFQEDLAPDDELKTSDRPVTNTMLHAEPSSDEEVASATVLRPSAKHTDSLFARGTASVVKPGLESSGEQLQRPSMETTRRRNVAVSRGDIAADSSEDETSGCGAVVRQDDDISDEEQQNVTSSSQQVCKLPCTSRCCLLFSQPDTASTL